MIIAHRGIYNNENIPENSLKSFKKCMEKNIPIELDIQITMDNKLMIFHDNNLSRMTNIDKDIRECLYDDIKDLRLLNTNERIPTLDEVLELVNGSILLDIEVKDNKRINEICKLIIRKINNYNGEFLLKSFNPLIVKKLKKLNNNYKVGLLISSKYKNKLYKFLNKFNFFIWLCKPDFICFSKKLLDDKYYNKVCSKYESYIWTIKNEDELKIIDNNYKNLSFICDGFLLNKK